ncbi:hypothetical protein FRC07_000020 [Ceratobasidium sp. 392]|nr:hypothetical protein FRC07_000020 [Ceratobasidium sp. 392]
MVSTRRNPSLGQTQAATQENHDDSNLEETPAKNSNNSIDDEDLSEQDDSPAPKKKRARANQSVKRGRRKKYVKGKQGGLGGFMKLPLDIFAQASSAVRLASKVHYLTLKELNPNHDEPPFDVRLVHCSTLTRPKRDESQPQIRNSVFSLRPEVEEVLEKQKEFHRARDRKGLAEWEGERRAVVSARNSHAIKLLHYFNLADMSHGRELDSVKQERREAILKRLKELGWTDRDMEFEGTGAKSWRALVEVPKPLTDRVWSNMLPKLTPLLEVNRQKNLDYDKKRRRILRRTRVDKFLMEMKFAAHPYRSLLEALGVGVPPLPDLDHFSFMVKRARLCKNQPAIANPFPGTHVALKWNCLNDLSEVEMSVEEVEAKFEARRLQIEQRVLEWRTAIERQLVEKFESGSKVDGDVVLLVKGGIGSTAHLSRDSRILLRADTIFKRTQHDYGPLYYPDFVCSPTEVFCEDVRYPARELKEDVDLGPLFRDNSTEKIAKSLLKGLGMPDVARIELQLLGPKFVCGRCIHEQPKSWHQMLKHYADELKVWNAQKDNAARQPVRHPIVVRYVHEPEPSDNPNPLVKFLTEAETAETTTFTVDPLPAPFPSDCTCCFLCLCTGRLGVRLGRNDMAAHLREVHDVTEPVADIHFGPQLYGDLDDKWHERWDAFHDACMAATEALGSSRSNIQTLAATGDNNDMSEVEEDSLTENGDDLVDGENHLSEQDDIPAPKKKRARTNQTVSHSRGRRYVKGKQGGLEGFMKLPMDIFAQISELLSPADLVILARCNKFFRNLLLQRSAVQIWRRVEANVPDLPPCPPDMCEPQYAALVFLKHCTLCGASATAKPDFDLYVRLCASCRNTGLREFNTKRNNPPFDISLVHWTINTRPKRDKSQPRTSRNSVFSLKLEVEEVLEKQKEFHRANDQKGLATWEDERRAAKLARQEHALKLMDYFESVNSSRDDELANVKSQRREVIVERLKALGWTDRDMDFYGTGAKPWRTLVEAPKPLTDKGAYPNFSDDENREKNLAYDKRKRRVARRTRVDKFLMEMKYAAHPYQPILEMLGAKVPPPPNLDGLSGMRKQLKVGQSLPAIINPFPWTHVALKWDCLNDLSEVEMGVEEVEAKFEARKPQIEQRVLEWRAAIERQLVEKFESGSKADGEVVLLIKESTHSASHLSNDTRFLLRADTVFKREPPNILGHDSVAPVHYPDLLRSFADIFDEDVRYHYKELDNDVDLEPWVRDIETEKIVKSLLRDLMMPDVAHIDLKLMKSRFVCGRCTDQRPKSWDEMVRHYISELKFWNIQQDKSAHHPVYHPIIVQNVHDLEVMDNSKPLVRLLTEEESTEVTALASDLTSNTFLSRLCCYLCRATGRALFLLGPNDMPVHLYNVHDVAEPVPDVHFGHRFIEDPNDKWHEKWDSFHEARSTETGATNSNSTSSK